MRFDADFSWHQSDHATGRQPPRKYSGNAISSGIANDTYPPRTKNLSDNAQRPYMQASTDAFSSSHKKSGPDIKSAKSTRSRALTALK